MFAIFLYLGRAFGPASFPNFPQKPGKIEESRLEEESEADPLVVLVVFLLLVDRRGDPWVWHLQTNVGEDSVGDGEGGVNPAVGIHHVLGDVGVHNAVNGISNILTTGDQETAGNQDHHGSLGNKKWLVLSPPSFHLTL